MEFIDNCIQFFIDTFVKEWRVAIDKKTGSLSLYKNNSMVKPSETDVFLTDYLSFRKAEFFVITYYSH